MDIIFTSLFEWVHLSSRQGGRKFPFGSIYFIATLENVATSFQVDFMTFGACPFPGPSINDVRFFCLFFDLPTYPCPILSYYKHPILVYSVRFWQTYLPTPKSDVIYGRPLMNLVNWVILSNFEKLLREGPQKIKKLSFPKLW